MEPMPIEKVRYNQEFRFPGAEPWDVWGLVLRVNQKVGPSHLIEISDRRGNKQFITWGTLVVPTQA